MLWHLIRDILHAQPKRSICLQIILRHIYLQTEKSEIYVFDAVESMIVKRTKEGIVISITNPTRYDANISIFAETMARSKKPLAYTHS